MTRASFVAVMLGLAVSSLWAQADQDDSSLVGAPYTDTLRGFSLCPPAGTERNSEPSTRRLAGWVKRDAKTGAIRWTLELLNVKTLREVNQLTPAQYADLMAQELAKTSNFKVDSTPKVGATAGKPSMTFTGTWSGALQLWRNQVWVLVKSDDYKLPPPTATGPAGDPKRDESRLGTPATAPAKNMKVEEHLVLDIAGTFEDKAEMSNVIRAVAGTLKLFDPVAARNERADNLARGVALLASLTADKLRASLREGAQYYTVTAKGQPVGFFRITEKMGRRSDAYGVLIVREGSIKIGSEPRQLFREQLFSTPDRAVESWKRVVLVGEGKSLARTVDEAIKQQELLVLNYQAPGEPLKTDNKPIPKAILDSYLPQALSVLLPRLIDRATPAAYGVAIFNAAAGGFDLRTIRMVGPDKIVLAEQQHQATLLTDQMAPDAPLANVWLDAQGILLRMKTAEGLVIERSDAKAIAARFGTDVSDLDKLEK